jgi:hypothetical protein
LRSRLQAAAGGAHTHNWDGGGQGFPHPHEEDFRTLTRRISARGFPHEDFRTTTTWHGLKIDRSVGSFGGLVDRFSCIQLDLRSIGRMDRSLAGGRLVARSRPSVVSSPATAAATKQRSSYLGPLPPASRKGRRRIPAPPPPLPTAAAGFPQGQHPRSIPARAHNRRPSRLRPAAVRE